MVRCSALAGMGLIWMSHNRAASRSPPPAQCFIQAWSSQTHGETRKACMRWSMAQELADLLTYCEMPATLR